MEVHVNKRSYYFIILLLLLLLLLLAENAASGYLFMVHYSVMSSTTHPRFYVSHFRPFLFTCLLFVNYHPSDLLSINAMFGGAVFVDIKHLSSSLYVFNSAHLKPLFQLTYHLPPSCL